MVRGFVGVLPHCPAWLVLSYTRFMARVAFFLLSSYRKRMEENLTVAFGNDISTQERKALVWAAWLSFARGVLDTPYILDIELRTPDRNQPGPALRRRFHKTAGQLS